MVKGWIRFKRECWKLRPDWRDVHRFMSTQALTLGSTALTVLIAVGASSGLLLGVLAATVAATLIGALVEQEELEK